MTDHDPMLDGTPLSHPKCKPNAHVCQQPSGRTCVEAGCNEAAGTLWGPLWCPDHDFMRLERISASFDAIERGVR